MDKNWNLIKSPLQPEITADDARIQLPESSALNTTATGPECEQMELDHTRRDEVSPCYDGDDSTHRI